MKPWVSRAARPSSHASIIHFDHYKGLFSISPEVNQRIVCLAGNLPDSS